jgi:hypothetical protein
MFWLSGPADWPVGLPAEAQYSAGFPELAQGFPANAAGRWNLYPASINNLLNDCFLTGYWVVKILSIIAFAAASVLTGGCPGLAMSAVREPEARADSTAVSTTPASRSRPSE